MAWIDGKHVGFVAAPSGATEEEMRHDDCLLCGAEWNLRNGSGSQAHKRLNCGNIRLEIRKAIAKFNADALEHRKQSRWYD